MQTATRADLPSLTIRRGRLSWPAIARVGGKTVLTVGLIVVGFVVYQFWVTSLFAGRAQAGLERDFADHVGGAAVVAVPYRAGSLPEAPIAIPDDLDAPTADEVAAATPGPALSISVLTPEHPAIADLERSPTELPGEDLGASDAAMVVSEPTASRGEAIGRIIMPSANIDWTFVEGVTRADLRNGAGHMPGTALPGGPGNAVISGHRTTYGAPFSALDRAVPGDLITVETASGTHVYQVIEQRVVKPTDVWVAGQWDGAWLTLTTCNPRFSARERLIVFARLVGGPNAAAIVGSQ